MLLTKEVEVKASAQAIKYYESLGYKIPRKKDKKGRIVVPRGTTIKVKVEHLPPNTNNKVEVLCDYCMETVITMAYSDYYKRVLNGVIKKACCKKCKGKKIVETNLAKYGVRSTAQRKEQRELQSIIQRTPVNEVRELFYKKGFIPLFKDSDYINGNSKLKYECPKHPGVIRYVTRNNLLADRACEECGREKRMGENNHNWKGGVTPLNKYLRQALSLWYTKSKKACNYKCVITGEDFDVVHHLYAFELIMQETFEETGIDIRSQINDYTQEELDILREKCLEIHYRYPLGVCLKNEIHYLFHSLYGKGANTPEQFEEFKQRCESGEFDHIIHSLENQKDELHFKDLFEWGKYLQSQKEGDSIDI